MKQGGIEDIVKPSSASGEYMYHNCRMKGHGRLRRCLTSTIARAQVKLRTIAWLINSGLGIE